MLCLTEFILPPPHPSVKESDPRGADSYDHIVVVEREKFRLLKRSLQAMVTRLVLFTRAPVICLSPGCRPHQPVPPMGWSSGKGQGRMMPRCRRCHDDPTYRGGTLFPLGMERTEICRAAARQPRHGANLLLKFPIKVSGRASVPPAAHRPVEKKIQVHLMISHH